MEVRALKRIQPCVGFVVFATAEIHLTYVCHIQQKPDKGPAQPVCQLLLLSYGSDSVGFLLAGSPSSLGDLRGSTEAFMLF